MKRAAVLAWIATVFVAGALLAMPLVAFAATGSVSIKNFAFTPTPITVHVGDTVTWTNNETAAVSHTSTSDTAGLWSTGPLAMGEAGSFTFTAAGTFAYHCAIHASMHGTVTVLADATSAPPPTPIPTVRTSPPTVAPTPAPSTPQPTASPAPSPPATATPSASATATTVAAAAPSAAAPAPGAATSDSGSGPVLIGVAAVAVAGLAALAFFIARRR